MHAVYRIMCDERALIAPLWKMVDDYVEISRTDKIKFAMAAREMPEIRASIVSITEDLDESLSIVYNFDGRMNVAEWQSMDLTDRLSSLRLCTFKYESIHRFHDVFIYKTTNLLTVVEIIKNIMYDSNLWYRGGYEQYKINALFMSELFDAHRIVTVAKK